MNKYLQKELLETLGLVVLLGLIVLIFSGFGFQKKPVETAVAPGEKKVYLFRAFSVCSGFTELTFNPLVKGDKEAKMRIWLDNQTASQYLKNCMNSDIKLYEITSKEKGKDNESK